MENNCLIKTFDFENKDVLIYGAGGLGRKVALELVEQGYSVAAFIDKNGEAIHDIDGIPVFTMEKTADVIQDKNNCVIVVCLHNALWHQDTALELYKIGFDNLIFLPIGNQYDYKKRNIMEKNYGLCMDMDYKSMVDIPTYSALCDLTYTCEDAVISKDKTCVTVWMDITSIYTNKALKQRGNDITKKYGCVSVCALKPYNEMFHYCKYGDGDIELYCKAFKKVQNADDIYSEFEFIYDRIQLYKMLKKELNLGMQYFINAAPQLKWDDGYKRFYVLEGHHRIAFLYMEGFRRIPVKISKDDFEIWKNEDVYRECKDYILDGYGNKLRTPIDHPGFFLFDSDYEDVNPTQLMLIQEFIGTMELSDKIFFDLSGDNGYYARALKKMGCKKCYTYCDNEKDKKCTELINRLCYLDGMQLFSNGVEDISGDIAVVDMTEKSSDDFWDELEKCYKYAKRTLFVLAIDSIDMNLREKPYKRTIKTNSLYIQNKKANMWVLDNDI